MIKRSKIKKVSYIGFFLFALIFILGIIYRLWLVGLVPQPYIMDQAEYHIVASELLGNKRYMYLAAHRSVGYPLFLALIYSLFGQENTFPWISTQAIIDSCTAIIVFLIARRIFKSQLPAWISYILYVFNPFTSSYVGVRLTEVLTTFLLSLVGYLSLKFIEKKESVFLAFLGFVLGYLSLVKTSFVFFSLLILFFILKEIMSYQEKLKKKAQSLIIFILMFSLPFLFSTTRNYLYFRQINPLTIENNFVKVFYVSLYIDREDLAFNVPKEVSWIYQDYAHNMEENAEKFRNLAFEKIKSDPWKFLKQRALKMWYVWEKHYIFPYANLKNNQLLQVIYWGNISLLAMSFLGFIFWLKQLLKKSIKSIDKWVLFLVSTIVIYISVIHTLTATAGRYSLPAYPYIILFAGYSTYQLGYLLKGKRA